jgi:hypothetical protein
MAFAFYLSVQVQYADPVNPDFFYWRNCLNEFVDVAAGDWFTEYQHPARRISLCLLSAPQSVHDTVASDPRVVRASPFVVGTEQEYLDMLATSLAQLAPAWRSAAQTFLEERGFDTSNLTGTNTYGDLVKRVINTIWLCQMAHREHNADLFEWLRSNLDDPVSSVPVAARNAVADWMQRHTLDTSWISGATTVREVLAFIRDNAQRPAIKFAGLET